MPRASHVRSARRARSLLPATVAFAIGAAATGVVIGVGSSDSARAATAWPAHVFAPYVDTGLSNTTLTTVAADYGTQFFTLAFVNGGGSGGGSPTPTPTPTPTTSSPSGSCAAAWVDNAAYVSGNEVSYNGANWTANQWNYDEVPGGPSGAWNNDGPC